MAAVPNGSGKVTIDISQIIQGIIIALVTAGIIGWSVKPHLDHMRVDIEKNGTKIDQMYDKLFTPINYNNSGHG